MRLDLTRHVTSFGSDANGSRGNIFKENACMVNHQSQSDAEKSTVLITIMSTTKENMDNLSAKSH